MPATFCIAHYPIKGYRYGQSLFWPFLKPTHAPPLRSNSVRRAAAQCCGVIAMLFALALGNARANELGVDDWIVGVIRFVTWPDEPAREILRVCYREGERVPQIAGRKVSERILEVRAVRKPNDLGECQALVFENAERPDVATWIAPTIGQPILTIAQGQAPCKLGAAFCLVPAAAPRGFDTNLDTLSRSGLRVSSQLLRMRRMEKDKDKEK